MLTGGTEGGYTAIYRGWQGVHRWTPPVRPWSDRTSWVYVGRVVGSLELFASDKTGHHFRRCSGHVHVASFFSGCSLEGESIWGFFHSHLESILFPPATDQELIVDLKGCH